MSYVQLSIDQGNIKSKKCQILSSCFLGDLLMVIGVKLLYNLEGGLQ